jgi:hypothetical protein
VSDSSSLTFVSVLKRIREQIIEKNDHIVCGFADWLFDHRCPLIVRQIYAVMSAVLNEDMEEVRREFFVFSLLINPWYLDVEPGIIFWCELNEATREDDEESMELVVHQTLWKRDFILGESIRLCRPYFYTGTKFISPPEVVVEPFDRIVFSAAMFNMRGLGSPSDSEVGIGNFCRGYFHLKTFFTFMKSVGRIHWTRYLIDLYQFIDSLQELFKDQLNLLYVILSTLNSGELVDIGYRMFGFGVYMQIQDLIQNKAPLMQVLQNHQTVDQTSSEFDTFKKLAKDLRLLLDGMIQADSSKGTSLSRFCSDGDIEKLRCEFVASDLRSYGPTLIRFQSGLATLACGLLSGDSVSEKLLVDTIDPMVGLLFKILRVDQPLVRLLRHIQAEFGHMESAYDQLNGFVSKMVECRNSLTFLVPETNISKIVVKAVIQEDLYWNATFSNTIIPVVAQLDVSRVAAGYPADRLAQAICCIRGDKTLLWEDLHDTVPGSVLATEKMSPLLVIKSNLELIDGEDFMGYRTEAVAASLIDGMPPETRGADLMWQRLGHVQLSLRAFLLAWSRLTPVDGNQQSNSTALALLLGIFVDDDLQEQFCDYKDCNLEFGCDSYYLWYGMKSRCDRWNKTRTPPQGTEGKYANLLGHTIRFEEVLARIAYDSKRQLPWNEDSERRV